MKLFAYALCWLIGRVDYAFTEAWERLEARRELRRAIRAKAFRRWP